MQIVIEIPENEVPDCQEIISMNLHFIHKDVCECTYPFKVLPEHHGRLIDADAFAEMLKKISKQQNYNKVLVDELLSVDDVFNAIIDTLKGKGLTGYKSAPTIIEATE